MSRPDRRPDTIGVLRQALDLIERSRDRDPQIVSDFWIHKLEALLRDARRIALRQRSRYTPESLRSLETARALAAYLAEHPDAEAASGAEEIQRTIERLLHELARDPSV